MTRDDIRRMAKEAGLAEVKLSAGLEEMRTDMWQHFAELVAAAEREACAKVCESEGVTYDECMAGQMFAREIRARNQPTKGEG